MWLEKNVNRCLDIQIYTADIKQKYNTNTNTNNNSNDNKPPPPRAQTEPSFLAAVASSSILCLPSLRARHHSMPKHTADTANSSLHPISSALSHTHTEGRGILTQPHPQSRTSHSQ